MSRGVVAGLRDFVPLRPLTRAEAFRIAEMQATRFLAAAGVNEGPVPEEAITELPKLQVKRFHTLPVSGATEWSHGRWLVLIKGSEPITRQRFSIAHEFKHILDHRFIAILYQHIPRAERAKFVENVCDYFAGCVLMPRPWIKSAWGNGIQRPADLAATFAVSEQAIRVRLSQIGLGEPPARCSRLADWTLPEATRPGTREPYRRRATTLIT